MKNLILTICLGEDYQNMAKLTHPTIKKFAEKINAEFICISEKKIASTTSHWEKFQIFDLLTVYNRILFIDTDIIIREDCPNLFDIVPENKLGIFNEAPFTDRSKELIIDCCKAYGKKLPSWNGKYYNSGVMVVSRNHRFLFQKPDLEYFSFFEQTYLNLRIAEEVSGGSLEIFELDYRFNRMCCVDRFLGEHRCASYIIHYAGFPSLSEALRLIKKDKETWNSNSIDYKKHIYVSVTGGLGDQISAEPAIRFMREKIFPNDDIIVATHHPKIFEHLNISTYVQGTFPGKDDTPLYLTESLPGPESMTWSVVSNLLCHTVDYCSMALLHRTLPLKDRQIKLRACEEDLKSVEKLVENPEDYVIVHPGRHWNSKTLPLEYWQEIIDRMSEIFKIIIIGKDEKTRGTLNVKCPTNALDLRNLLDLGSLIALISKGKMVVSNDSAPIHIAGAFDNWIALIPTCKHPDHVLPYRNGSPDYKSLTLYKKLPADEFNTQPTCITTSSAEFIFSEWNNYLLTPIEIVEKIKKVLGVNGNHIPIDKNIKVHSFVAEIPV
jgi:hypothetical protein